MKFLFFIIFFVLTALETISQDNDVKVPANPEKIHKLAMSSFKSGDFFMSNFYFEKLIEKDALTPDYALDYSILLYDLGHYSTAYELLKNIEKKEPNNPIKYYYLSLLSMKEGLWKESLDYAKFFVKQKNVRTDYKNEFKSTQIEIKQLDSLIQIDAKNKKPRFYVSSLIGPINTPAADFNPIITNDGILYGSQKLEGINYYKASKIKKSSQEPTRQIYSAIGDKNKFTSSNPFALTIKDMELSGFCLDFKGRILFMTGCKYNEDSARYYCQIYQSKLVDGVWSEPQLIPELYSSEYSSTHVSLGIDPATKNTVLFFSSNRKPSSGGFDIFVSTQNPKTFQFYPPRNLGNQVNSTLDDITPFFHTSTNTLFFSSNGRGGQGGHDVFFTQWKNGVFSSTTHVESDINCPYDDVFFTANPTLSQGYLVSNRYSENSLINPHCCDDIFYWSRNNNAYIVPEKTKDTLIANKQISSNPSNCNTTLKVRAIDQISSQKIDNFNYTIWRVDSSQNTYLVKQGVSLNELITEDILPSETYLVEVTAHDYYTSKQFITIENCKQNNLDIKIEKINHNPIILPLVEFEFDSFVLTAQSREIINKTVYPILINNPNLMIELSAHTDSRGETDYNMTLSEKRAYSIYKYLVEFKGIDARRIQHKGYGEYVPIVPNENPDGSDNDVNRQRNRRCEFKILSTEFDPY